MMNNLNLNLLIIPIISGVALIFLSGPGMAVYSGFRIYKATPKNKGKASRYLNAEILFVSLLTVTAAIVYYPLISLNNELKAITAFGYAKEVNEKEAWTSGFYVSEEDKLIILKTNMVIINVNEISIVDIGNGSIIQRITPPADAHFIVNDSPAPFVQNERVYCAVKSSEQGITQAVMIDSKGAVTNIDIAQYDALRENRAELKKSKKSIYYEVNNDVLGYTVASTDNLNIVKMDSLEPNSIDIILNDGYWRIGLSGGRRLQLERLYIIDIKSKKALGYCELAQSYYEGNFNEARNSELSFVQSGNRLYILKSNIVNRQTTLLELDLS